MKRFNNVLLMLTVFCATSLQAAPQVNWSHQSPAQMLAAPLLNPGKAPVLAATNAGSRVVAVGEYGTVLLIDQDGQVRQAREVPTRATLTSVFFVDQRHGWAVGHQGVILRTRDGGEHWTLMQADPETEALFSVWFENELHGFAAGRFATLLETHDGGENWTRVDFLNDPDAEEVHLFHLFDDSRGGLYATSEFGQVFVSRDKGLSWQSLQTDFGGSLWSGVADQDGNLVVVGMVGAIQRSDDGGRSWQRVDTDSRASFTQVIRMEDGTLVAVGLNGIKAVSRDGGQSFSVNQRADRASMTAAACLGDGSVAMFSKSGLVR